MTNRRNPTLKKTSTSLQVPHEALKTASEALQKGDIDRAYALYSSILEHDPKNADAVHMLGVIESQRGNHTLGLNLIEKATALAPQNAILHCHRGNALMNFKRFDEALASYETAIRLRPDYADAFYNRGHVLVALKRLDEALVSYDATIRLKPDRADAFNARGTTLLNLKRFNEALASYETAIRLKPDHADAHHNRGSALLSLNRFDEALASYDEVIRLKPGHPDVFNNRGNALLALKRPEEALASYDAALRSNMESVTTHCNKGHALVALKRLDEALVCYEVVQKLQPDYDFLLGQIASVRSKICQWGGLDDLITTITVRVAADQSVSSSFPLLSLVDDPSIHRRAAHHGVQKDIHPSGTLPERINRTRGPKIHIAYLSADFRDHPISHLMVNLIELHDRSRFELTALSFGTNDGSALRLRVSKAFDRFEDVQHLKSIEIARRCRELGVDIAVDLMGYTQHSRPGILVERCAPIQINWLGYPGTMAASFIDYIVADRTLITESDLQHYSEKVIWLPDTYQANDPQRAIDSHQFTRTECDLPESGFVFCCFNNPSKILPATFDVWMRILHRVPGSVLWLLEDYATATTNLCTEAQARGIDPNRLVFAKRIPSHLHLARHRVADLFIDTWPYNAHTTASDALWAGLPVLTRSGRSFASRVAASLLRTIGLPELITQTDHDYEQLAVTLAQQPGRLQTLKDRLAANRLSHPLFDSLRFTRHLEMAYQQVIERHWNGQEPAHIDFVGGGGRVEVEAQARSAEPPIPPAPVPQPIRPESLPRKTDSIEDIVGLESRIEVMDIGAACISEVPVYRRLLDRGIAHLHAFEGDQRQIEKIAATYGSHATVHPFFLFDGSEQTVHLATEASGMTSLLRPKVDALKFFNGFDRFGTILSTTRLQTKRLDDVKALQPIDFVKMDIQGAELTVLQHGLQVLQRCIAIQLEISFIALYENQPTFGQVDVWMRANGFVPHCFVEMKKWSISPMIRNNNFRIPFNQLLEADIVYIRDPLGASSWTDEQLRKLAVLAHDCFSSFDLAFYLILELNRRYPDPAAIAKSRDRYLQTLNSAK